VGRRQTHFLSRWRTDDAGNKSAVEALGRDLELPNFLEPRRKEIEGVRSRDDFHRCLAITFLVAALNRNCL